MVGDFPAIPFRSSRNQFLAREEACAFEIDNEEPLKNNTTQRTLSPNFLDQALPCTTLHSTE
jgi:hypothetical protein